MRFILLLFTLLTLPSLRAQNTPNVVNYGQSLSQLMDYGFDIGIPLKETQKNIPNLKKSKNSPDQEEYHSELELTGMNSLDCFFSNKGKKLLYKFVMNYENADTLEAFCKLAFGQFTPHPVLADNWVLNIDDNGIISLIWRFENKLIVASNLPDSDIREDFMFSLDEDFIAAYRKAQTNPEPGAEESPVTPKISEIPEENALAATLNKIIDDAPIDFNHLKADEISGKNNQFHADLSLSKGTSGAIIREMPNGIWRFEDKLVENAGLKDAQSQYNQWVAKLESLETLEYRLVRKTQYSTDKTSIQLWVINTLDDAPTDMIVKLILYAGNQGGFSIKIEIGKD